MADITLRRYDAGKVATDPKSRYPRRGDIMRVFPDGAFTEDASPDSAVLLLRVTGLSAEAAKVYLKDTDRHYNLDISSLPQGTQDSLDAGEITTVTAASLSGKIGERMA